MGSLRRRAFIRFLTVAEVALSSIPLGRVSQVMAKGLLVCAILRSVWFTLVSNMELEQSRLCSLTV